MRAAALRSSLISRIVYFDALATLRVHFRNGTTYVYSDVPREAYEALRTAESPGSHYNRHIRERYPCTRDPPRKSPRTEEAF